MVAPFDLSERLIELDRTRTRSRPRGQTGAHHRQTQFARRPGDHRETLRSFVRRREDRSHRPRDLLSAPESSRSERKHSRHQHRGTISRAQPRLLF